MTTDMGGSTERALSKKDQFMLHFMSTIINKINTCYANIYALQTILIKKGIVTAEELIEASQDAKAMPQRRVGREALAEIIRDLKVDHLAEMIEIPSENDQPKNLQKSIG